MPRQLHYDRLLCLTILGLTFFGLLMVFSVTAADGDPNPTFIIKQSVAAFIGLGLMRFLMFRDYHELRNQKVVFGVVGAAIVLLALAFVVGSGARTGRWLDLGFFSFQPSELAKLAVIVFLAYYLETYGDRIDNIRSLAGGAIVLAAVCLLIFGGRDLGTAVAIMVIAAVMLWTAGLQLRWFLVGIGVAVPLGYLATIVEPYRVRRFLVFLDPEADPLGAGFQVMQSKIAVGSGGLLGQGLLLGRQKMRFLPEAHTDFIFGVIGEETGLVGCLLVVSAFAFILWRGLHASMRAPDAFGRYLAVGVTAMIVCQAMINVGVVLSMLPTKGLPLPFISYGGSSLMMSLAGAGLLLNVSQHAD
ncbi:MAG: putative lipid II flippase FtsW [Acidobacteria bacterium]|nr:putative lipid II flippase FtsW [Acidobacteriota bacterium]